MLMLNISLSFLISGCDWLHEISITVRATREVSNITNERLQRLAMLESNSLLKNLLTIAADNGNQLMQSLAMDILIWIVSIRLARYRCPRNHASSDVNVQQTTCVSNIESYLTELINKCILLNNRSMAHKCVKLVVTSLSGAQNMVDQLQCFHFEVALKNAILTSIPDMIKTSHAGSIRWFSLLISGTSNAESQGAISTSLMQLLVDVLQEISGRPNTLNSILQSRFGLYGMPFESELFDSELPSIGRSSNLPFCNVSSLAKPNVVTSSNGQTQQMQQNQFSDLKSYCSSGKFENHSFRIIRLINLMLF